MFCEQATSGRRRSIRGRRVAEDELCFFTFEADSDALAVLAAQRAGLGPLRVVEAVSSREE